MTSIGRHRIQGVVLGLDRWFDAMRVTWPGPGYGGPVVHWWNHCLDYCGTGLDWRYEGIVAGYLALWRLDGNDEWLAKARRAGDDLLAGQLNDGHFRNSGFERNPCTGGTPHEAAADVALLRLALAVRGHDPDAATRYAEAARRNLEQFYFKHLWHGSSRTLRDRETGITFVPNKAATFIESVLLLAEFDENDRLIGHYAVPTGDQILAMQRRGGDPVLDGAIAQNRFDTELIEAYFPLYIARCVVPLIALSTVSGEKRFAESAMAAAQFLAQVQDSDGGFPQVLYAKGRLNRQPRWIAGAGDVLHALVVADPRGFEPQIERLLAWMLAGVQEDGRIATAHGFGRIVPLVSRRQQRLDELGVVGWCDKAFRALAIYLGQEMRHHHVVGGGRCSAASA